MNERIRELMAEADRKCSETRGVYDEILAELIVEECGEVAYRAYWDNPETVKGIHIKEAIREYFGVGE